MIRNGEKREFYRWMTSLSKDSFSDYDNTFMHLLIENFDEIAGLDEEKRAVFIGQLIEQQGNKVITDKTDLKDQENLQEDMASRLDEFQSESGESLFFKEQYTFLCESEKPNSMMLFKELKNALSKNGEKNAVLTGTDKTGKKISITSNSDAYRYCLVEKNRIDEFAKTSVALLKSDIERLGNLFGYSEWNNYVNGFTQNFDNRYLTLAEKKDEDLVEFSDISVSKKRKKVVEKEIQKLKVEEEKFLSSFKGLNLQTLEDVKKYLSGEDGVSGIIGELQAKVLPEISDKIETGFLENIRKYIKQLEDDQVEIHKLVEGFLKVSLTMDYNELYLTIRRIGFYSEQDHVVNNPFEDENEELIILQELMQRQSEINEKADRMNFKIKEINDKIQHLNQIYDMLQIEYMNYPEMMFVPYEGMKSMDSWSNTLKYELEKYQPLLEKEDHYLKPIIEHNNSFLQKKKDKVKIDEELAHYRELHKKEQEIESQLTALEEEKRDLDQKIKETEKNIQKNKTELVEKNKKLLFNENMKQSYDKLITGLKEYRELQFVLMSKDLSEKAKEYYNRINELSLNFEKLEVLVLPNTTDGKIVIRFDGETKEYEAFEVLSEDNMTALGFSILLAKITQEELGFILLDEVVDEISPENREGVAELLAKCEDINKRQIIMFSKNGLFIESMKQRI